MTIEEYLKSKNKKEVTSNKKTYKQSLINRTLLSTTIVLILLIITNINSEFKDYLNKYVFLTNYNFAKINTLYKKYVLDLTKKQEPNKTQVVNKTNNLEYYSITPYKDGAKLEIANEYNVKALGSGLVVFIGEKEGYGKSVVVQQSNGIDVTYGGVEEVNIKVYDYVSEGVSLGTAHKELYLVFEKDGESVDYKEYIK